MDNQLNKALDKAKKAIDKHPKDKAMLFAYLNGAKITTDFTTDKDALTNLFYNLFTHHDELVQPALNALKVVLDVSEVKKTDD